MGRTNFETPEINLPDSLQPSEPIIKGLKIAFFGPSRSGKNVAGRHIWEKHNAVLFAFGDEMKEWFHKIFTWIPREPKPVDEYIKFAQGCRDIDFDVWVKKVIGMIDIYLSLNANVVITDLRQPNEYQALKERGFTIVKLHASEEALDARIGDTVKEGSELVKNNPTELHFDTYEFDYEIHNSGTIEEFIEKIDEMLHDIKRRQGET